MASGVDCCCGLVGANARSSCSSVHVRFHHAEHGEIIVLLLNLLLLHELRSGGLLVGCSARAGSVGVRMLLSIHDRRRTAVVTRQLLLLLQRVGRRGWVSKVSVVASTSTADAVAQLCMLLLWERRLLLHRATIVASTMLLLMVRLILVGLLLQRTSTLLRATATASTPSALETPSASTTASVLVHLASATAAVLVLLVVEIASSV